MGIEAGDKWLNSRAETLADGKTAITVQCTIACAYGGIMTFLDDGQGG